MSAPLSKSILLLDCGTSSLKSTLLVFGQGEFGLLDSVRHESSSILPSDSAVREWNPELLIRIISRCICKEAQRASENGCVISTISATCTTSSLTALAKGNLSKEIPSLAWDDRQAWEMAAFLEAERTRTSTIPWMCPIDAGSGIAKALFLTSLFPEVVARPGTQVIEQWTYLNWLLTGAFFQSDSILVRKWGLHDTKRYPQVFAAAVGAQLKKNLGKSEAKCLEWLVETMLPGPVCKPGAKLGALNPEIKRPLGIRNDVQIIASPYDTVAQAIGLGLVSAPTKLGITFGTSLGVMAMIPNATAKNFTFAVPECPLPGLSFVFDGIASCGNAINQVCRLHGLMKGKAPGAAGDDETPDYEAISRAISSTRPGTSGVTMLPFFNGGRRRAISTPSYAQIDGITISSSKEDLVRALCEAICFSVRRIVRDIEQNVRCRFAVLAASGGPSACTPLMQMLADITGCEVEIPIYRDTGLLGCATCAFLGMGLATSLADARRLVPAKFVTLRPRPELARDYDAYYKLFIERYGRFLKADVA